MRHGVLAAGNFIVDKVKSIDVYPAQDCLANILAVQVCNGGGPFNLLVDLARLGVKFPLAAAGLVGADGEGDYVRALLKGHGVDTSMLGQTDQSLTASTDVMSVVGTARRTFFHHRGANALLKPDHLSLDKSGARIFYLGYLLLLDGMDQAVGEETGAAVVLKRARELGMVTAVDVVSEDSRRFRDVVVPSLPHIDLLFMNEIEAGRTTGVEVTGAASAARAADQLLRLGVNRAVFIHMPEGAYGRTSDGDGTWQGSVCLPEDMVAGAVGAGDAFAAGVLAGWHEGLGVSECLTQGVGVAAACLTHQTTSDGVGSLADCMALGERFGFRPAT